MKAIDDHAGQPAAMQRAPRPVGRQDEQQARLGTLRPAHAAKPQLRFSEAEVCRLTGLLGGTMRHWVKRGWITPIASEKYGRGRERFYSAWQTVAFAVIAAAHAAMKGGDRTYLGRTTITKAFAAVADLDDALLMAEADQDVYVAESAAKIASDSLPDNDLPGEACEILARVVKAIDRKAKEQKAQVRAQQAKEVSRA